MKLGCMSDLHGNAIAVAAVIADAALMGVDAWWVLGDIVALGPNPVEVLEMIAALPKMSCLAGNTERYVVAGDRPSPSIEDTIADPSLLPTLIEVAVSFAWTRGAVTQAGWYAWLAALPQQLRMTLPDGTRLLGVHASPGSDDGAGIDTRIGDEALAALLAGCDADVVLAGHTHDLTDRTIEGTRAINLGSVSNPSRADRCATYAIIDIERDSHHIGHRVVDYDHAAAADALDAVAHPARGYIGKFHRLPAEPS